MRREDGRGERKRRGGAAIWGLLRFREKVALSSDMQAYVKKSVVVQGGETGLAAPWTAGDLSFQYTTKALRAQALSGEKIF